MRDAFLLSFVLACIPFIVMKPHVGALLWAWVSYMYPHRLSWGFMYDFPLAMLIGVVTIGSWLISKERKVPPNNAVTVLIIVMAVWVSITTFFAYFPDDAFRQWDREIKLLVMTVITITMINSRERLYSLIWIVVVSLGFYGAKGGLFTALGSASSLVLGPTGSFLADNNSLSLALIMLVPLIRYLQLQSTSWYIRIALYGGMLLMVFAIIGTYSRAALLGMGVMLFLMAFKSRRPYFVLAAGLVAAVFALAFTPERWIERMETIQHFEDDSSVQGRFQAWTFSFRFALDHPITGGGFTVSEHDDLFLSYVPEAPKARSPHSIIFEMLGEHGFVGLFLYLTLMTAALSLIWTIGKMTRDRPDLLWAKDLMGMVQVSMAGYVVTGLSQDHAFFDVYYLLLTIIAVTYEIVKRETAKAVAPVPGAYETSWEPGGAVASSAPAFSEDLGRGR